MGNARKYKKQAQHAAKAKAARMNYRLTYPEKFLAMDGEPWFFPTVTGAEMPKVTPCADLKRLLLFTLRRTEPTNTGDRATAYNVVMKLRPDKKAGNSTIFTAEEKDWIIRTFMAAPAQGQQHLWSGVDMQFIAHSIEGYLEALPETADGIAEAK